MRDEHSAIGGKTLVNRRLALAGLLVSGGAVLATSRYASAQLDSTPVAPEASPVPVETEEPRELLDSVTVPAWEFGVQTFQDPYAGRMTTPESLPGGVRVVAIEVVIENKSDQPLEFATSDVRLRDDQGFEYRAGEYLGTEPRLVSQNLPDGERTRGWVWFGLPESAQPDSIVFVAPPPILRIGLD